jgi:hypothetical protein
MLGILAIAFFNNSLLGIGLEFGTYTGAAFETVSIILFFIGAAAAIFYYFSRVRWLGIIVLLIILLSLGIGMLTGIFRFWNWNASTIIFFGIWLAGFFVGISGDVQTRQIMGVIFVIVSLFIYSMGVGSQNVGFAFFGDWWPTVHNFVTPIMDSVGQAFSQVSVLFGNAWNLITNPVGYAQNIMNGTYAVDPKTGLAGAFGVELEEMQVTPIYAGEPYTISIKARNKGAYDAENVQIGLFISSADSTAARINTEVLNIKTDDITKYETYANPSWLKGGLWAWTGGGRYYQDIIYNGGDKRETVFPQQYLDQRFFGSKDEGISCTSIIKSNLRNKYLALTGNVKYDYQVDSSLSVEFISDAEWNRLAREGKLATGIKKASQLQNSPVRLNIDTLEQPVKESSNFFVALQLVSAKGPASNWFLDNKDTHNVTLEIPKDFTFLGCSVQPQVPPAGSQNMEITWDKDKFPKTGIVYCYFGSMAKKITGATQTFMVTAHANYGFTESVKKDTMIQFGGNRCCNADADCAVSSGEKCNVKTNLCGPGSANGGQIPGGGGQVPAGGGQTPEGGGQLPSGTNLGTQG